MKSGDTNFTTAFIDDDLLEEILRQLRYSLWAECVQSGNLLFLPYFIPDLYSEFLVIRKHDTIFSNPENPNFKGARNITGVE